MSVNSISIPNTNIQKPNLINTASLPEKPQIFNATEQKDEFVTAAKPKRTNKPQINAFLNASILLLGGVALGYSHRDVIGKAINGMKTKFTQLTSTGQLGELANKGKEILGKAKDMIMSKA